MPDATRTLIAAGIAELVRTATTPLAPFGYGRDLKCIEDLTSTLEETNPDTVESLAQDLYHRFTTARGTLVDDLDFGEDARGFLSEALTPAMLLSIGGRLALEGLKDDRVAECEVDARLTAPGVLTITIQVTPADPRLRAFAMVMGITATTIPTLEIL